ncbi:zinc/manganese transport system substrate-binding protein [Microterricola gilva]|uniref:Zinc/manganese transport system substrate-binding protein n=1 Tax=Microterricola gilva TaxID=393267 RepID=A0A4Q8AQK1_9MICO|nr:zinc ABC transporter substrate-binding protein [Microterricola gilva]RZU67012.1 zinc/manganese transport system substrate-binding protein [Microterricola gilva]
MNSRRRVPKPLAITAGVVAATLGLAGCASASGAEQAGAGDQLSIVAATSVYGQIAGEIAGDAASVTSIIDSSVNDPHSYEASARDRLAVSRADVVIMNGGGYDAFMGPLLADAESQERTVLDVSEISGLLPADEHDHADDEHADEHSDEHAAESDGHDHIEGFNEHLWYDFDTMRHLAEAIEAELTERSPGHAAEFSANAAAFDAELGALEARTGAIADAFAETPVAITEPVPLYLLEAAGLHNETPAAFSEAIEEGDDVAPRALQEMLAIIETPVALLAYNAQTASPQTELVREAALAASVPVVDFAETLPDGSSYISWMDDNVSALEAALAA